MNKKAFSALIALGLSLCCSTASAAERLAPPPIVSQWKVERVKVVETGEFSSIILPEKKAGDGKKGKKTVDLLAEKGKKFFWKPSPLLSSAIRSADLTGAALSHDGTLAVIAERVGGEGKANSTRLLFFDIPGRRLAGGFTLPEILVSSIAFLPGSSFELTGIRHSFAPYKVKDGLVKIDLRQRDVSDALDSPAGKITSFAFGPEGRLFFSAENTPAVYEVGSDSFAVEPAVVKCRIASPRLCVAGASLIAYGSEGIEIFRLDRSGLTPDEKIRPFPQPFTPVSSSVIDAAGNGICFAGVSGKDLWYFRNGSFRKLKERISGIHLWDEQQQIFFAEVAANSRIVLFQMPEASEDGKPVSPNRLKPANRNGSFALLRSPSLGKQMVQIDTRGNVFLLDYSKLSRWKKYVIFIADRAGFR